MHEKAEEIRHLNFMALGLFPVFCATHGVFWHACKFYDDEEGLCSHWFGDSQVVDLSQEVTSSSKPLKKFFRAVFRKRKNLDKILESKMMEQQSHWRMELIREANFAMAFLFLLGTWLNLRSTGSTPSTSITLQLFLVETLVACAATYDAFLAEGRPIHGSVLMMAGWTFLAFSGFLMTLALACSSNFRTLMGSLIVARGGMAKPPSKQAPSEATNNFKASSPEAEVVEQPQKEETSITVTVNKKVRNSFVGMGLMRRPGNSQIFIASLSPKGLFGSQKELQAGQVIISINGKPTDEFSSTQAAAAFLKTATGDITIVARSGSELPLCSDESSVLAAATKASTDSFVGVELVRRPGDWRIVIASLAPTGLFGSCKLRIGQTILAINNTSASELKSSQHAISLLEEAIGKVTILATSSLTVTVEKARSSSKVGLAFSKKKLSGSKTPTHHFMIHKVDPTGLFGSTQVDVKAGMRILAINGHPCIPTSTTIDEFSRWVKECIGPLTMVLLPEQTASPPSPVELSMAEEISSSSALPPIPHRLLASKVIDEEDLRNLDDIEVELDDDGDI